MVLPELGAGLKCDTNNLYLTGAITVGYAPGGDEPYVDATNAPAFVPNDIITCVVAGTNNIHVVGGMHVSNTTAGGACASFPASESWTSPPIGLIEGTNEVAVVGTNMFGVVASDTVTVVRGMPGTGTPFIDITNETSTVADDVEVCVVAGTNNTQVVGSLFWTNELSGGAGALPVSGTVFQMAGIPIAAGSNTIHVIGTNQYGAMASDSVTIIRMPPPPSTNGIWINLAGGSWTNTANWQGGAIASGADMLADISTLNITAYRTITLDKNRTIGHIKSADTVPSRDWTMEAGTPSGVLTLAASLSLPTITVVNRMLAINAVIAGSDGLCKSGTGTLELMGSNTYSGPTVVSNGVLTLSNYDALGNSAVLAVLPDGTCDVTGIGLAVPAWRTLRGRGTMLGDVDMHGVCEPGDGIGILTVEGNVTLGSSAVCRMEINRGSTPTADKLAVSGMLTCGGRLTVTNVGGELQVGDMFDLFDGAEEGAFDTIDLPVLASGRWWFTGLLCSNGTIMVTNELHVPSDVEEFLVGHGASYGQILLTWSNNAVAVLACTNRTYSANPADWFVLTNNIAAPWTHSAASNFPSIYYRIVSGNCTSAYDVEEVPGME